MGQTRNSRIWAARTLALCAGLGVGMLGAPALAVTSAMTSAMPSQPAGESAATQDVLIFKSGRTLRGTILSETQTTIRFRGDVNGIPFESEYPKADLLEIRRAPKADGAAPASPAAPAPGQAPTQTPAAATGTPASTSAQTPSADAQRVYFINLDGEFGVDITQTPIRQAVKQAQNANADVIVVRLNNRWAEGLAGMGRLPEDVQNFDELFRAESIIPIFTDEIPREWTKQPRVVFWVDDALGGAAFLPFIAKEIYTTSDARWGGIGGLDFLFGDTGDAVVRDKQYSLRLGHAEGWAIRGGYDARIIRAMTVVRYVLSYRITGGQAELLERMPENPGEVLLTWDGNEQEGRADSVAERVRGEGKDVLTLNARLARDLGVSRGIADTEDDLLFQMGLARVAERVGTGDRVIKSWSDGLDRAKERLRDLWREYGEVPQDERFAGDPRRIVGKQINILSEMIGLLNRYEEAITPRWHNQRGVPPKGPLETQREQLRLQMMALPR
jgi:hypothetical protein